MPATRCCSCSGRPSALFLPLIALAGLRMVRGVDTGPDAAGHCWSRRSASALIGIALGLYAGSAVSGLPAGYGGALGLAGAYGVDSAVELVGNPSIEGPLRLALMAMLALGGLRHRLARARHPARGEAMGGRASCAATPARRRGRAAAASSEPTMRTASRRRHARARRSPSPTRRGRSLPAAKAGPKKGKARCPARPAWRWATITSCRRSTCWPPPPEKPKGTDRPRRAGAQCAAARERARGFPRPRRHRRGPPRPGRHHVRAGAGQRDQGQPGDPAGRRHRPQHVGAVGARRDHPRAAA